jgi:hypothetical protein
MKKNLLLLWSCLMLTIATVAQERGFKVVQDTQNGDQRIALIIGNSGYTDAPLINPVNDAKAMALSLKKYGFEVILKENANSIDMKKSIRDFGKKLQGGGVGLFYYAGHGMQVKGENYLIPVGTEITNEEEVEYEAVNLGLVLAQMEVARNQMNIIILDACRNNPFAKANRSSGDKGLATVNAPTGTLIAYATAPGSVAADGSTDHGLYTQELLAQMNIPNQKIEDVFKKVRGGVVKKSEGKQIPWESSSLIGDFYFSNNNSNNNSTINNNNNTNNTNITNVNNTVVSNTTDTNKGLYWKANTEGYFIYDYGTSIQNETSNSWSGSDLIVYHANTGKTMLLRNYSASSDNKLRPVEQIATNHQAVWKSTDAGYFLYVKGVGTQGETVSAWVGDDLLVHHEKGAIDYIFRNYKSKKDGQLRVAETIYSPTGSFWTANTEGYRIYFKGKEIQDETDSEWKGDDLIVNHKPTGQKFRLKSYEANKDGQLRVLEFETASTPHTWRANSEGYFIYVGTKAIQSETKSVWVGDDLLVYHENSDKTFILRDYENNKDNKTRDAETLYSDCSAFWKADDAGYYIYVKGVAVQAQTTSEWSGDHLIVTYAYKKYKLKNYEDKKDSVLRPAEAY